MRDRREEIDSWAIVQIHRDIKALKRNAQSIKEEIESMRRISSRFRRGFCGGEYKLRRLRELKSLYEACTKTAEFLHDWLDLRGSLEQKLQGKAEVFFDKNYVLVVYDRKTKKQILRVDRRLKVKYKNVKLRLRFEQVEQVETWILKLLNTDFNPHLINRWVRAVGHLEAKQAGILSERKSTPRELIYQRRGYLR